MKIVFRLTYEDFQEALTAHLKTAKKPASVMSGSMPPPNGVLVITNTSPKTTKGSFSRSFLGWIIIISVALLVFFVNHNSTRTVAVSPPVRPPKPLLDVFLILVPWLFVALIIWFFFLRQFRGTKHLREKFNQDPSTNQERLFELIETGICVRSPTERHEFDWLAFTHVAETDNLFLLYQYPLVFQIVPKRAFASPQDVDAFRQIIGEKIGDRRTGAFPVEPAKA